MFAARQSKVEIQFSLFLVIVFLRVNSVYSVCIVHGKNQRHYKGNRVELKGVFSSTFRQGKLYHTFSDLVE